MRKKGIKMKKHHISLAALLIMFGMLISSCGPAAPGPAENTQATSDNTSGGEPTGEPTGDVTTSGTEAPETPAAPKSLKILAIGNSFSTDCMQYLYDIMKSGGVENIVLGNLYYGGCSLAQHLDFAKNNKPNYTYYKNTSGSWDSTAKYLLVDALKDEEWDYITFQQTSKTCGLESSYGATLTSLVDFVEERAPKSAKFLWNMTWAYQQDSTHSSFPNYDKSQKKMYDMILNCVEKCIKPEKRFVGIIPCMTSVQNARTSFLGDTLTRDGYHLDYYIGRYIAGLTWFSAITGLSPEAVAYNPSESMISPDMVAVAREAVAAAIKTPGAVTQSAITEGKRGEGKPVDDPSVTLNPADFFEADSKLAAGKGTDLSKYSLLTWEYIENGYWYCTKNATVTYPGETAGTYKQNVCTKRKFSIEDLPAGSIVICDKGWQYRLEIYPSENEKYTGTRPTMNSSAYYVITEEFLNGCKYIAWNVASNPKSDISQIYAQAACHVRVYVPVK